MNMHPIFLFVCILLGAGTVCLSGAPFPTPEELREAQLASRKAIPIAPETLEKINQYVGCKLALATRHRLYGLPVFDEQLFLKSFREESRTPSSAQANEQMLQSLFSLEDKLQDLAAQRMKKAEEHFLSENRKKEGVRTLENGLQYIVQQMSDDKQNMPITRADMLFASDLTGQLFYATRIGDDGLTDMNDLPPCIAEISGDLPPGHSWTFYIPRPLLEDENPPIPDICGVLVLTFRTNNSLQWENHWEQTGRPPVIPSGVQLPDPGISDGLRRLVSETLGRFLACLCTGTRNDLFREIGIDILDVNPQTLAATYAEMLRRPLLFQGVEAYRDIEEQYEKFVEDYRRLHRIRMAERDRILLERHAACPGVTAAPGGIYCESVRSDKAEENHSFEASTCVKIGTLSSHLMSRMASPAAFSWRAKLPPLPDGISWIIYVPLEEEFAAIPEGSEGIYLKYEFSRCKEGEAENPSPDSEALILSPGVGGFERG
ncbi:MAG: FKBP-type peptidyl-prolyl cis-trans isomerase N-terminal domain-containing protein [Akkermansiaceae bacterium]|nr:FKBP-type peptidyl-prolyl cis-trans isomerase N-terminal domain-containing protein [Akkermansiaceae bacterium]